LEAETYLSELREEFPEVVKIHEKLVRGETLNTLEMELIVELSKETGWSVDAVMDEIKNLDKEPPSLANKYKRLFEEYYKEAKELKEKKDYKQAGEKLWDAITALIKLYASKRGIRITAWTHAKLYDFVDNNVSNKPVKLPDGSEISLKVAFSLLLSDGRTLHENFYEDNMHGEVFEIVFNHAVDLIDKIKKAIDEK